MPSASSIITSAGSFVSGLQGIVNGMNSVANQISPLFFCVAFVLLVFGSINGFMQNDSRHLFGHILRIVVLVALIGSWQIVSGIVTNAVNAFCCVQINASFGPIASNSSPSTTARLDIAQLANTIQQKATGTAATPAQSQPFWQQAVNVMLSPVTHPVCQVLYAIYLLALLLCELVVVLMDLLQRCILVFLGLYVPVGFAEFSIPSLRGQGQAFLKTYIGVQCWPVGWVFVNIVTIALFQKLVAPNPEDIGSLLISIIGCVPVFLWVVIGHILAPFYAQKLVVRGGAELQAFVGAMISTVGGTTGTVYGNTFALGRSGAQKLGSFLSPEKGMTKSTGFHATSGGHRRVSDTEPDGNDGASADDLLGGLIPPINAMKQAESVSRVPRDFAGTARGLVARGIGKTLDTVEFSARTAGNIASTLGSMVADASSNRIGPERNFSFPQFGRRAANRSSRRAADYLNYQEYQN